jgi:hypothetical protein
MYCLSGDISEKVQWLSLSGFGLIKPKIPSWLRFGVARVKNILRKRVLSTLYQAKKPA